MAEVTQDQVNNFNKQLEAKGEKYRYKRGEDGHLTFDKDFKPPQDPNAIKIVVENPTGEKIIKMLEKDREEKPVASDQTLEYFRGKVIEKAQKLGIPLDPKTLDSMESIEAWTKSMKELEVRPKEKPAGAVPLAGQYEGDKEGGFDSVDSMVKSLQRGARSSNKQEARECKQILDMMFKKFVVKPDRSISVTIPNDDEVLAGKGIKDLVNEEFREEMLRKRKERKGDN